MELTEKQLREIIKQLVKEMSTTSNVPGYSSKKWIDKKEKEKIDSKKKELDEQISDNDNKQKIRSKLIEFFTNNKYPKDKVVHKFAEKLNINEHDLETEIYSILTDFFAFGKYNEEKSNVKINPKELELGKKIEMEHTNCPEIAERIALDHLSEIPDYYTRLIKMEKEAEK